MSKKKGSEATLIRGQLSHRKAVAGSFFEQVLIDSPFHKLDIHKVLKDELVTTTCS